MNLSFNVTQTKRKCDKCESHVQKKKKKKGGKRERQTCLITMFVDSHNEEIFGLCRRCERIQETRTDQELEFCITSSTLEN